jgi:hypothetical protein
LVIVIVQAILFQDLLLCGEKNDEKTYFAIVYSIGENWDTAKPALEQQFFSGLSNFLSELRKWGRMRIGAGFAEYGLIVIE